MMQHAARGATVKTARLGGTMAFNRLANKFGSIPIKTSGCFNILRMRIDTYIFTERRQVREENTRTAT